MSPYRRTMVGCSWRYCLLLVAYSSSIFAQGFVSAGKIADVQRQAQESNRLIVVIQSTDDFSKQPLQDDVGEVFRTLTLNDPAIVKASHDRCMFVCQAVGSPGLWLEKETTSSVRLAIYFCTAKGEVLHLLIGAVGPDELMSALSWSERIAREAQFQSLPDAREHVVAGWHASRIAQPARTPKNRTQARRETRSKPPGDAELRSLIAESWQVHREQLLARFGKNFRDPDALLRELAVHGEPRTDFAHLIFSRIPLVSLADIQAAVAETCLDSSFWELSSRRDAISTWLTNQRDKSRPVLLVLVDNSQLEELADATPGINRWLPKSSRLKAAIAGCSVAEITHSEFVTVIQDHDLHVSKQLSRDAPRFAILAPGSAYMQLLDVKGGEAEVAEILRGIQAMLAGDTEIEGGGNPFR